MNKKEIKDYLKQVDELGNKLIGEDKETYTWLIYGYNRCAKLLNETEQQCKKQQEVIDRIKEYIEPLVTNKDDEECYPINFYVKDVLLSILKEVSE